jgi:hypothetical protein
MTTKKSAIEMMNPSEEELERGQQAARDLVAHMKRMGAAGTSFEIPDGDGEWTIAIEWKSKKKPN